MSDDFTIVVTLALWALCGRAGWLTAKELDEWMRFRSTYTWLAVALAHAEMQP